MELLDLLLCVLASNSLVVPVIWGSLEEILIIFDIC